MRPIYLTFNFRHPLRFFGDTDVPGCCILCRIVKHDLFSKILSLSSNLHNYPLNCVEWNWKLYNTRPRILSTPLSPAPCSLPTQALPCLGHFYAAKSFLYVYVGRADSCIRLEIIFGRVISFFWDGREVCQILCTWQHCNYLRGLIS